MNIYHLVTMPLYAVVLAVFGVMIFTRVLFRKKPDAVITQLLPNAVVKSLVNRDGLVQYERCIIKEVTGKSVTVWEHPNIQYPISYFTPASARACQYTLNVGDGVRFSSLPEDAEPLTLTDTYILVIILDTDNGLSIAVNVARGSQNSTIRADRLECTSAGPITQALQGQTQYTVAPLKPTTF